MQAINPATEEVKDVRETPLQSISGMVEKAKKAQILWGEKSLEERIRVFEKLCSLMEREKDSLTKTITEDMGKPLDKSEAEVERIIEEMRFFCRKAMEWLAPEQVEGGHVEFDPLGVVAVISPWNYPLLVPFSAITPALLAGNAVVFKPSEYTLLTGIAIGKLFSQLESFPENVFQTIVGGKEHGKELVKQDIAMVSFTGSTRAGKDIMKNSSEKLHKVLLELGGLDAAIVLKDADIPFTAKKIIEKNCQNTGQVCCSIKRVYVEKEVYDDFVKAAKEESKKVSFGDPEKNPDMGPLVAKFQLDKVEDTLEDAKQKGVKVLSGGKRPEGKGYYFPSTILTNVNHDMKIMKEEPFGPLLPILPVDSWEEAVALANNTRYGLAGSVWTKNKELGKKIAKRLEVGVAGINAHGSGPVGTPWGGAKESGMGRMETREGMREFTNIKLVQVQENG